MFNLKHYSVLVIVIIFLNFTSAIEPRCSSYEYDEKILERLVRTEFKFDNAMQTIEAAVGNVAKGLTSLKEDKLSLKKEMDSLKEQVRDFVREVKLDINETLSLKTAELENVVKQQQAVITRMANDLTLLRNQTIDDIKKAVQTPNVAAFHASLSTNTIVSSGTDLIFPDVRINHGNGYDVTTGHFTATVTGTFIVTVQVCPVGRKGIEINLVVDGSVQTKAYYYGVSVICYTTTDVLRLQKNNELWVKFGPNTSSSSNLYHNTYLHTYFAAVLVKV